MPDYQVSHDSTGTYIREIRFPSGGAGCGSMLIPVVILFLCATGVFTWLNKVFSWFEDVWVVLYIAAIALGILFLALGLISLVVWLIQGFLKVKEKTFNITEKCMIFFFTGFGICFAAWIILVILGFLIEFLKMCA